MTEFCFKNQHDCKNPLAAFDRYYDKGIEHFLKYDYEESMKMFIIIGDLKKPDTILCINEGDIKKRPSEEIITFIVNNNKYNIPLSAIKQNFNLYKDEKIVFFHLKKNSQKLSDSEKSFNIFSESDNLYFEYLT